MYYTPRVNAAKAYPVDDAFFPPVSLSESQLAALRAEAAAAINKTLAKCGEYQRSRGTYLVRSHPPWKLHAEHNGLYEYKRSYERYPNVTASRVFGTIQGNYMDVANLFKTETRKEYFNAQKTLFPSTVDAAVLRNLPRVVSRVHYEGIKWVAYDPLLSRVRLDSCHYEAIGEGTDEAGKPYTYRVILSVDLPEVPDLFKTKRTVRVAIKSAMIIKPSDHNPSVSEVFLCLQSDAKGHRIPRSLYKQFLVSLQSFSLKSKTRKTIYKLAGGNWVATKANHEGCSVCSRSFSILRSKCECSSCLAPTCRKCLVKSSKAVDVLPAHNARDASASKLCKDCVTELRQRYDENPPTPVLGDHVPSFVDGDACVWSGRRSSREDWVSSPVHLKPKKNSYRRRLETATSFEDELLSSGGTWTSSGSDLDLSFRASPAVGSVLREPEPNLVTSFQGEVILEEEREPSSSRSVEFTLNTSQMERVRDVRDDAKFQPSSATRGSGLFESIHLSLQEQSILLHQLQKHSAISRN